VAILASAVIYVVGRVEMALPAAVEVAVPATLHGVAAAF